MAHQWTKEQAAAIANRDRTLLVSAAAGSGKTATLTQRIIQQLTDPDRPISVTGLLVVTFTNAAVAELRERIDGALRQAIKDHPENPALPTQLLLLPAAKICTIDAFCNDILRECAAEVGVLPNYRIADTAEAALLSGQVMDRLIGAVYAGVYKDTIDPDAFAALCDCLSGVKNEKDLYEVFLYVYRKTETHLLGVDALAPLTEEYKEAVGARRPVEATGIGGYFFRQSTAMLSHHRNAMGHLLCALEAQTPDPKLCAYAEMIRKELGQVDKLLATTTYEERRRALGARPAVKAPPLSAEHKAIPAVLKLMEQRRAFEEDIKRFSLRFFSYSTEEYGELYRELYKMTKLLYEFLALFDRLFTEEKRAKGLCEYADIERLAYQCLWQKGERTPYAVELSERFASVYIDEYQDVNPLQNKIFEAVGKERNRFMVGDIKQSIYSFRSADPTIFAQYKARYPLLDEGAEQAEASIFLSDNFRCDEPIVDFVNRVFDPLFSVGGASIGYVPEDRLRFAKPAPTGQTDPMLYAISVPTRRTPEGEEEGEETPENRMLEARAVGRKIRTLLAEGIKNDGSPIRPKDIAVLFRALKDRAAIYAGVFAQMGIPVAVPEDKDFFLNPEVLLTLSLLNVIDNPKRDIHLCGLLLSPLYSFTPDELLMLRGDRKDRSLYDALADHCAGHPDFQKGRDFLSALSRYRLIAEGMPVDKLLRRLYTETGLYALAAGSGGRNNLSLLVDYARRYEKNGYRGLYSFIHYINALIQANTRFDDKRKPMEDSDEVRLLTVHASKGLEYPVCILADTGTTLQDMDSRGRLLYAADFGLALRLQDPGGLATVENPVFYALKDRRYEILLEEELRILYVALTRARERLYVFGLLKGDFEKRVLRANAYSETLSAYGLQRQHSYLELMMAAGIAAVTPEAAEDEEPTPAVSVCETADGGGVPVQEEAQTLANAFTYAYPHDFMTKVPQKLSVSFLSPSLLDEDGRREEEQGTRLTIEDEGKLGILQSKLGIVPKFISGTDEKESAKRGVATHAFLQFCDFARLKTEGAQAELLRLQAEEFLSPQDAQRVRLEEICAFVSSALFERLCRAKALYRELRFHARLPARLFTDDPQKKEALGEHRLLVQGVMDCVMEEADGTLCLIDYKTDRLRREELADRQQAALVLRQRHTRQLSYYALAVRDIFGRLPDRIQIYALHLKDTVDVPMPADLL